MGYINKMDLTVLVKHLHGKQKTSCGVEGEKLARFRSHDSLIVFKLHQSSSSGRVLLCRKKPLVCSLSDFYDIEVIKLECESGSDRTVRCISYL